MQIGTLSFEIQGENSDKRMVLSSAERREIIACVADKYSPDLLLCAGFSLDDNDDLDQLAQDRRVSGGGTFLIVEVQTDRELKAARDSGKQSINFPLHRIYLIVPGKSAQPLGRHQVISQSKELSGQTRKTRIDEFEKTIPDRQASIEGHKLFALCCGEINVLKGRDEIQVQVPAAGPALIGADIIVNPTHDLMGNAGTLVKKRAWLSRRSKGRNRVYISASNWNSKGRNGRKQSPDSETLHTVYFSGKRQTMMPLPGQGYMYRECEVPL